MKTTPVPLLLACLLAPAPARAQEPDLRADLERFKAEVAVMADTAALRRLEYGLGGRSATMDVEAVRRLRRGMVRRRLAALGDGWSHGRAAEDFARASVLAPHWPLAWTELGDARQAEASWIAGDLRNLGHRLGGSQRRAAIAAYARASDLDPAAIPPLAGLVESGTALRDTAVMIGQVLARLRRAASTAADTATGLLAARARLERELGDPDSAVNVALRFAQRSAHPGLSRLELARSLFARGESRGATPYFEGAADDDSVSVAAYRQDLAYIAGDSVLAAFDNARAEGRIAVLRRFWQGLDRRDLRNDGEWLREHYRRLAYARRHFTLQSNRPRYHVRDGYDSGSDELDDRGIVYLRHGEPDRIAGRTAGSWPLAWGDADQSRYISAGPRDPDALGKDSETRPAAAASIAGSGWETWLYFEDDSLYLVEFAAGGVTIQNAGDPDDYRLVPYLTTLPGGDEPLIRERIQAIRPDLLAYFSKALGWGPHGQAMARAAFRRSARDGIARATTTVSHQLRFRRRLAVTVQVFVVGRSADSGLAHIVYAIPRTPAFPADSTATGILSLHLRFMAEEAGGAAVVVDTTARLRVVPQVGKDDWILGRFEVRLAPGAWRYRFALEAEGEFGRVLPPDSLTLPVAAGLLAVSDPAMGQAGQGIAWPGFAGEQAWFQVGRPLRRTLPLDLYFEVYGLAAGESFQTTLLVRAGRKTRLTISSEETATEGLTPVHRTAALSRLSAGRYTLQIRVTAGGRTVESPPREIEVTAGE
jgi:GWxTD domain-containing protein